MSPRPEISYDREADVITLCGIQYGMGLFRALGLAPIGGAFKIVRRDPDGVLQLQAILPPYSTLEIPAAHTYMGRQVLADIALERARQIDGEGFAHEHDDRYTDESLAVAAACYVLYGCGQMPGMMRTESDQKTYDIPRLWPWHARWWKPKTRRRDLVRAAALLVAEIERIDRSLIAGRT